ncbi:MAG: C39 family peptidase [bacterium]|nr:C39 family peptidase [bacterium]
MKKNVIILFLVASALILFFFRYEIRTGAKEIADSFSLPKNTVAFSKIPPQPAPLAPNPATADENLIQERNKPPALPREFNLNVPFTSQAPFADWSMPYKEGCEEASVFMVNAFYRETNPDQTEIKKEIDKMVNWQMENFKEHRDLDASDMVKFIQGYYGYQDIRILGNPILEEIKNEILAGHPVILPTAGQLLRNPYFRQPGPVYHMLVLRGWTKNGMLIANDPGTKRGENYLYNPETILNAMHDWNKGDVLSGEKIAIIIKR